MASLKPQLSLTEKFIIPLSFFESSVLLREDQKLQVQNNNAAIITRNLMNGSLEMTINIDIDQVDHTKNILLNGQTQGRTEESIKRSKHSFDVSLNNDVDKKAHTGPSVNFNPSFDRVHGITISFIDSKISLFPIENKKVGQIDEFQLAEAASRESDVDNPDDKYVQIIGNLRGLEQKSCNPDLILPTRKLTRKRLFPRKLMDYDYEKSKHVKGLLTKDMGKNVSRTKKIRKNSWRKEARKKQNVSLLEKCPGPDNIDLERFPVIENMDQSYVHGKIQETSHSKDMLEANEIPSLDTTEKEVDQIPSISASDSDGSGPRNMLVESISPENLNMAPKISLLGKRKERRKPRSKLRRLGRPPKLAVNGELPVSESTKCKFCEQIFTKLEELRLHATIFHESEDGYLGYMDDLGGYVYDEAVLCKYCQEMFITKPRLRVHVRRDHATEENFMEYVKELGGNPARCGRKQLTCKLCPGQASNIHSIYEHAKKCHNHTEAGRLYVEELDVQTLIPCEKCDKTFRERKKHYQHMFNVHQSEVFCKDFVCLLCKRQFKNQTNLTSHMRSQHEDGSVKRVMCHLCPSTFSNVYNLKSHIRNIHHKQTVQCPLCDATLNNAQGLRRHTDTVHYKRRPHLCQHCGKSFGNKSDLKVHVTVQHVLNSEGLKPHTCDYCGKSFASWRNHRKHINLVHLKRFPFNCKVCDRGFPQGKPFVEHVRKVHPSLLQEAIKKEIRDITYESLNLPVPETKLPPVAKIGTSHVIDALPVVTSGKQQVADSSFLVTREKQRMMESPVVVTKDAQQMIESSIVVVTDAQQMTEASVVVTTDAQQVTDVVSSGVHIMSTGSQAQTGQYIGMDTYDEAVLVNDLMPNSQSEITTICILPNSSHN